MSRYLSIVAILGVLVSCTTAQAIVLDWDTVTWANGSLSNSYNIDPAFAGNDVTVTVAGNTAQLGSESTGQLTPAITTNVTGGLSPVQNALTLNLDLANQSQTVTITVNFSTLYPQGVNNVSFSIFDVDFASSPGGSGANFQDQISNITATTVGGSIISPFSITTSADNTLSGSGLTQVVTGNATANDTTSAGNVLINFGTNAITSFTFTYGSGTGTNADPTAQHIAIGDISFTPVPEINPAWTAFGSCGFAALGALLHRRKVRNAQRRGDVVRF